MKTLLIGLMACLLVLPVAGADAAKKKTKTVSTTGKMLGHNVAPSAADGSFVFSGSADDAKFGDSAVVATGKNAGTGKITGAFTFFTAQGTLKATLDFTAGASDQPDSLGVTGTVTITGGTGIYKGAKGKGTVNGTDQISSGYYDLDYKFTVKYKK